MNRGIERRVILLSAYYKKLPELLGLLVRHYGTRIHSYVLMPNHYHPRESRRADLSEAMQWPNLSHAVWLKPKSEDGWTAVPRRISKRLEKTDSFKQTLKNTQLLESLDATPLDPSTKGDFPQGALKPERTPLFRQLPADTNQIGQPGNLQ